MAKTSARKGALTGASALQKKLGTALTKAVKKHRDTEVRMGSQDVPPDVEGVAQLTAVTFRAITKDSSPNKGDFIFIAEGTAVSPEKHGDLRVAGKRTTIMEPVYDTPSKTRKTVDEHVDHILNELKKMDIDIAGCKDMIEIEKICNERIKEGIFFEFATRSNEWKNAEGKTITGMNQYWNGAVDFEEADDDVEEEEGVEEELEEEEEPEEEEEYEEEEEGEEEESEEEGEEESDVDDVDLDALVEAADNDDEDAQAELLEHAEEAGVDGAAEMDEWSDVAAAIAEAWEGGEEEEEEGEEEEEEVEDAAPEVDEIYHIFATSRSKKTVETVVTAVDEDEQTVTVHNEKSDKEYTVSWDDLHVEPQTK